MTELNFLRKLKKERKVELVKPSEIMQKAYDLKSDNCLKSAKVLVNENLYENSVSESYYAMYNATISLFFKIGIKSENHTGTIMLLKVLLHKDDLNKSLADAKKERIDKQYYVPEEKEDDITKEDAEKLLKLSEEFILQIRTIPQTLTDDNINELRKRFEEI